MFNPSASPEQAWHTSVQSVSEVNIIPVHGWDGVCVDKNEHMDAAFVPRQSAKCASQYLEWTGLKPKTRHAWARTGIARDARVSTCHAHTHLSHAHFSAHSALCAYFAHLHACAHTRMAPVHQKGVCTCVISLHLAFSLLKIHPSSLMFFDGHFETNPDYDFTNDPIHMILPYFPVLKAQDMRHSAPASRSSATWPDQMQTQVMSPKSSTRSLLWMMTRCSSTIRTTISPTSRKPRTRTLDNLVFSQCLNPMFCTFLMIILLFG